MSTTKNDKLVEGKEPTGFEVGCSYEVIDPKFEFDSLYWGNRGDGKVGAVFKVYNVSELTGGSAHCEEDYVIAYYDEFEYCRKVEVVGDKHVSGKAVDTQVGGTHYKDLGLEPLAICLANKGYEAFAGSCYTKMLKYTSRIKDDEVEQLEKAAHVLAMWIDEAKNQKLKEK